MTLGRRLVLPVGLVLLSVVGASGCGDNGKNTRALRDLATAASTAPQQTVATQETALAEEAGLRPSDLPSGWTQAGSHPIVGAKVYGPDHCLPPRLSPMASIGIDHFFSFNLQPDGAEGGHLSAIVSVVSSSRLAADQLAYYNSPAYQPCMVEEVRQDLAASGGGIQVFDAQAAPLPLSLQIPGRADRVTIHYRFRGRDLTEFRDVVHVVAGRIKAHFVFSHCCAPVGADVETSAVMLVAQRLQAANLRLGLSH